MPRTKTQMSWKDATVTPNGGSATPVTEITDIEVMDSDQIEQWQADGHKYPTVTCTPSATRGLSITGGDIGAFRSIPRGTPFTFTAKLYDSVNGAGVGCLVVTLVNAYVTDNTFSGQSNKFATGKISIIGTSPDGTTDPLTVTQVTSV